jgi:hypothetical protein
MEGPHGPHTRACEGACVIKVSMRIPFVCPLVIYPLRNRARTVSLNWVGIYLGDDEYYSLQPKTRLKAYRIQIFMYQLKCSWTLYVVYLNIAYSPVRRYPAPFAPRDPNDPEGPSASVCGDFPSSLSRCRLAHFHWRRAPSR